MGSANATVAVIKGVRYFDTCFKIIQHINYVQFALLYTFIEEQIR